MWSGPGALTHFSREDVQRTLASVKRILAPGGVLSGQTDYEAEAEYSYATLSLPDASSLADLLLGAFPHVYIRQTDASPRINYYFFCSDRRDALPFSPEHPDVLFRSHDAS